MPSITTSDPKIAIVVLTWNGKPLTLQCVESLLALDYGNAQIIVVDNNSIDGTAAAIKSSFGDRVTVLVNDDNLGFSRGNNVGIDYAMAAGAEWILLLNNDTVVDPGLATALVATATEFPDAGVLGPKIYYFSPRDQIWSAGGEVSLYKGTARHIGIRETDNGQYDQARYVDYVTGCALFAKRALIEKIGGLDPSYLAYYEDTDFCFRARAAGFKVAYAPKGKVWHKISASTGGQLSARKVRRKLKSTFKFLRRHASPLHWLTIPLFFTFDVIRIIMLVATGRIRNTPHNDHAGSKP